MQQRKLKKVNPFPGYIRIREPNKEELAKLVLLAKGEKRSLREFASACGVNTSTLSRIINVKSESNTPNSDNLIASIAKNVDPDSGVTLEMLLDAHGIAPVMLADIDSGSVGTTVVITDKSSKDTRKAIDEKIISANNVTQRNFSMVETICREVLQNELAHRGYDFEVELRKNVVYKSEKIRYIADFVLNTNALEKQGMKTWAFDIHPSGIRPALHKLSWIFGLCYLESLRDKKMKFSLVITDEKEYEDVKERFSGVTIPDLISVIYIDVNKRMVVDEFVIPTLGDYDSIFKKEGL